MNDYSQYNGLSAISFICVYLDHLLTPKGAVLELLGSLSRYDGDGDGNGNVIKQ